MKITVVDKLSSKFTRNDYEMEPSDILILNNRRIVLRFKVQKENEVVFEIEEID